MSGRPRTPGIVYTGLAVAEFAPQALEQIKEAPQEQRGSGPEEGPGEGGGRTPPPPPEADVDELGLIDVPRAWRWVGDPPRQIEDPQSPQSFFNKQVPATDRPVRWVLRETNPALDEGDGGWGPNLYLYWPLLTLASGIQMAGPKPTPETFAAGLVRTLFPNPNHGAPPYYQAFVEYGPHDHTFWSDAMVVWWNPSAVSPENGGTGRFCTDGKRFAPGRFPQADARLFKGRCP